MKRPSPLLTGDKITLMLSMIPYLLDHGPTPITELAEHFEVDVVTVRSIMRFFGTAGIPGETATYQHEDLFDIDWDALDERDEAVLIRTVVVNDPPRFSPREVAALLAGLQFLTQLPGISDREDVEALMQKLALSPTHSAPRVDVITESPPATVDLIRRAILENTAVTFGYKDSTGALTTRLVVPRFLESVDDAWYLRAWCTTREALRLFRVDRMVDAVHSTLSASLPAFDDTGALPSGSLFVPSDSAVEVQLSVPADRVNTLLGFDLTAGDTHSTVLLADAARASRLASAAPGLVEVLAPAIARQSVVDWAERALAQYDA